MQKRFTHIVNHLTSLGKTFDTNELNMKILKSLNKTWQPKATTIIECASCKSYMFDLNILEKQLENALENKNFEKPVFKKK